MTDDTKRITIDCSQNEPSILTTLIDHASRLEERNKLLLDALKSLNDVETGAYMEHASQWRAWGEAKEKAKRAIGICEGGGG